MLIPLIDSSCRLFLIRKITYLKKSARSACLKKNLWTGDIREITYLKKSA